MAYLRNEKENFEIAYPIEEIWAAIPKVVKALEWKIEKKDEQNHKLKVKTKSGFMAYSSILYVELKSVDEKTSRMNVNAETPVTTITSVADFGRTKDRVGQFVGFLAEKLNKTTQ
jgi:hypothetical protein